MFKVDLEKSADILHPIISEMRNSESLPGGLTEGLIIKIAKKGDLSFCLNWRGITLLNTISKIISIIIHNRISTVLAQRSGWFSTK